MANDCRCEAAPPALSPETELQQEKNVTVGKGEEFKAYVWRSQVNVLPRYPASSRKPKTRPVRIHDGRDYGTVLYLR